MGDSKGPGPRIEEKQSSVQQIIAASTSNLATIGWTPKGPENVAIQITSFDNFLNRFGGFNKYSDSAYGVDGYFKNGGSICYFVRVCPPDAVASEGMLGTSFLFKATGRGVYGDNLQAVISGNDNFYDIDTATFSKFDISIREVQEDGSTIELDSFEALSLDNEDDAEFILDAINNTVDGSEDVIVQSVSGGIPAELMPEQFSNEIIGVGDGVLTEFTYSAPINGPIAKDTLYVSLNGTLVAEDNGEGTIEQVSGSAVVGDVDYDEALIHITFATPPAMGEVISVDFFKAPASEVVVSLTGGSDGDPTTIGRNQISASSLSASKQGLYAFDYVDEILNIALMDFSDDPAISLDIIAYTNKRFDVFGVFDCGANKNTAQAVRYRRITLGTQTDRSALYYPRINVADELKNGKPKLISPVCHVVGRFAYTDVNERVGSNPAGVEPGQLQGVLSVERKTDDLERGTLDNAQINVIREDRYVGKAIWGCNTLSPIGDFTQINARRLFMFVEKSFFISTHDITFKDLGPQLWAKLKLRGDGFLINLFLDGNFRGNTPEEAFSMQVDEFNNPASVVNAKTLIADIGMAVNEPGKIIRLRFSRIFPT